MCRRSRKKATAGKDLGKPTKRNHGTCTITPWQVRQFLMQRLKQEKSQTKRKKPPCFLFGEGWKLITALANFMTQLNWGKMLEKSNPTVKECQSQMPHSVDTKWLEKCTICGQGPRHLAGHRYISSTESYSGYITNMEGLQEEVTASSIRLG